MPTPHVQTQVRFERILLATDFSPTSELALAYAAGLAQEYSSTLELTNVIDLSITVPSADVLSGEALEVLRDISEEHLKRLVDRVSGVKVRQKTIEGFQPASQIVDEAVDENSDLIVLGTSSKHGLKKLALGSTAEQVIRNAPCPVLTVGPHVHKPPCGPISFQRIIYATDFSAQAAKAAGIAFYIGQTNAARIYLCHVVTEKESAQRLSSDAASIAALKALVPESAYDWCTPECVVEQGKSADAILALAHRVNADLIVLGARKSSFWLEYVRTGVTEALLAAATCPVLTVC